MRALVLEKKSELALREIDLPQAVGPGEVRIAIDTVGVCGSDVHYYTHGRIGPFVVQAPMVLGHEAAGTVVEAGSGVTGLKVGDRVCMEPGVPNLASRATKLGIYNVDPDVTFWATPPVHGVLIGLPVEPVVFDVPGAISREVRIETVFRYANIFDRALNLIASGKVDLKPLITGVFDFEDSVAAFERAARGLPTDVKLQIRMPPAQA